LGDRHRLLFNKFNIYDNHLLVVTREFESQKEQVSRGDLVNAGLVCEALQGIVFFNGGELSGASQPHKHLQILPNKARELPIFADVRQWVQSLPEEKHQAGEVIRFDKFEFLHGIVAIRPSQAFQPLGELLFEAYQSLFDQLITKNKEKYDSISDYNIIACDCFMLMAVRRK
jgi:sulfate adenylyltransferase (ADP) / ATP adenylyltransferase